MRAVIELLVNGSPKRVDVDADRTLLSVLREELGLTGTKYGCGEGQCGACTVILDGRAVRSCRTQVGNLGGRTITTVEGLAKGDRLHPVQQAFIDHGAMQCGYCTAGMLTSAAALLARTPRPTRDDIVRAMETNVCRCGTYPRIVDAIAAAALVTQPEGGR
jgi:aerobic-type carbon monoxide dehydrogenase small subunit (CoxS/CutS family)